MAPSRSAQGARLKNNHHTRTANEHASPPIITTIKASGATAGTPYQISHCSATAITPGQTRSGFLDVNSSGFSVIMSHHTFPTGLLFPLSRRVLLPFTPLPNHLPIAGPDLLQSPLSRVAASGLPYPDFRAAAAVLSGSDP